MFEGGIGDLLAGEHAGKLGTPQWVAQHLVSQSLCGFSVIPKPGTVEFEMPKIYAPCPLLACCLFGKTVRPEDPILID